MTSGINATSRQGNYAGGISRLAAFAADIGLAWASLLIVLGMVSVALTLILSHSVSLYHGWRILTDVAVVVWFFLYFTYQWALGGKTLGMAIFGLRVVTTQGAPISGRAAIIRTITLPLSILPAGLGLLGGGGGGDLLGGVDPFAASAPRAQTPNSSSQQQQKSASKPSDPFADLLG